MGGLTQNSVSPVPKKDWALVFWGFNWGLVRTWGLGLGLGLDNNTDRQITLMNIELQC